MTHYLVYISIIGAAVLAADVVVFLAVVSLLMGALVKHINIINQ